MRRGLAAVIIALAAQGQVSPEMILLGRIRVRVAENMSGLPNYTCTQTIERSSRRSSSKRFELGDTLRLEVALVEEKELYSWPGAERFEERDLAEMVGGTIGNGDFALFAKAIFLSNNARISIDGKETVNGRETVRLRYVVPRLVSGYTMRVREAQGIVGYEGKAWVDAQSLDLLRLEVLANDIPPHLPLLQGLDVIEYERQRIGDADFLLPKSSEMTMFSLDGSETRNRSVFSRCRQYGSSSTLTFDEPPPEAEKRPPPVKITLGRDLELPVRLTAAIQSPMIAKGDRFEGEITRDVKRKGDIVVPKGARVEGRVVEYVNIPGPYEMYALGLKLERITFENKHCMLDARLESPLFVGYMAGSRDIAGQRSYDRPDTVSGLKARDLIYVRGKVSLRPGFTMQWRTQDSSPR